MPMPRAGGGGITNCQIDSIPLLYASYMPFVGGGSLFVRSNKQHALGDEVFVVFTLPNNPERYPVNGKVVWVNHGTQARRPGGFAIQLPQDELGKKMKVEIEEALKPFAGSDKPTFTL